MKKTSKYITYSGFTLIELLVVIAIVGLISSVVLSSLNTARTKSRLSAVKQQMVQFRNALNLAYDPTFGYSAYTTVGTQPSHPGNTSWIYNQSDCDATYGPSSNAANPAVGGSATAAAQILQICKSLVKFANPSDLPAYNYTLLVGQGVGDNTKYSITVFIDSQTILYCMGSSGVTYNATNNSQYLDKGCYSNP